MKANQMYLDQIDVLMRLENMVKYFGKKNLLPAVSNMVVVA
jgi:hypothetical protein